MKTVIECHFCSGPTFIKDTNKNAYTISRVRQCKNCSNKHTTIEITHLDYKQLLSIKRAAKLTVNQIIALKELLL